MHKRRPTAAPPKNAGWKVSSHCISSFFLYLSELQSVHWLFSRFVVVSVRSSVCRMSSREKMSVQDQSKERGISGGLELNEDRESSPGTA